MAQYFLDTSALVKYYHSEAGTPAVSALFQETGKIIRISSLSFVEIRSAFAMKVRSGFLDRQAAEAQRARVLLDIAAGEILVHPLTDDHFAAAERLVTLHGFSDRLRALDALQLAVAVDLFERDLADYFVAADVTLLKAATLEGLKVINPETSGL